MEKYITVCVYREYEVEVSHLDPEHVRVEEFAKDEAFRMFEQEYIDGDILPCDFNTVTVGGVI